MPMSGVWKVSYSLMSEVSEGEENGVWLHLNDRQLDQTEHYTYTSSGTVSSTSGLEWTMEASAGDTITLRVDESQGDFMYINFCVDFIPKM